MIKKQATLIIILISLIIFLSCQEEKKQITKKENTENTLYSKSGKYLDYDYTYMEKDNKIAVIFPNKLLPRNDDIVVGAIKYFITTAYNETISDNSKPTLENRNGINLIKIKGNKSDYYVQLMKEDTGEVNSIVLWGESQ